MNGISLDNAYSCSAPSMLAPKACESKMIAADAFKQGDFGAAERNYRLASDMFERDAPGSNDHVESLLGLAASYDSLSRFDLADPIYAQLGAMVPNSPQYLNNYGYSLLLRGDVTRARSYFEKARQLMPENTIIQNNGLMAMGQ